MPPSSAMAGGKLARSFSFQDEDSNRQLTRRILVTLQSRAVLERVFLLLAVALAFRLAAACRLSLGASVGEDVKVLTVSCALATG
jgi:hypothetical protein